MLPEDTSYSPSGSGYDEEGKRRVYGDFEEDGEYDDEDDEDLEDEDEEYDELEDEFEERETEPRRMRRRDWE